MPMNEKKMAAMRARNSLFLKISRLEGTKKDKKSLTCTKESELEDDVIITASGISEEAGYYCGILLRNITPEYYFRKWREDGVCISK